MAKSKSKQEEEEPKSVDELLTEEIEGQDQPEQEYAQAPSALQISLKALQDTPFTSVALDEPTPMEIAIHAAALQGVLAGHLETGTIDAVAAKAKKIAEAYLRGLGR